jgi:hypothetical protein
MLGRPKSHTSFTTNQLWWVPVYSLAQDSPDVLFETLVQVSSLLHYQPNLRSARQTILLRPDPLVSQRPNILPQLAQGIPLD